MNLPHLHLDTKLGPFTRKHWLIGGGVTAGFLYYLHRRHMAQVAGATDATVAGATQNANGAQVPTGGTATDAGTTPMSAFDPYTSGYNGYGYDLGLGAGGIVGVAPVGQNGTDAGPVVPPFVPAQNPAAPGGASTGPLNITLNYPEGARTGKPRTVKPPSADERDTHRRKVRQSAHNVKNGRKHDSHKRVTHHDPKLSAAFSGGRASEFRS